MNFIGFIVGFGLMGLFFFVIGVFLLRWVLHLDRIVANQKEMIASLENLCANMLSAAQNLQSIKYYNEMQFKRVQAVQQQQARRTTAPATNKF